MNSKDFKSVMLVQFEAMESIFRKSLKVRSPKDWETICAQHLTALAMLKVALEEWDRALAPVLHTLPDDRRCAIALSAVRIQFLMMYMGAHFTTASITGKGETADLHSDKTRDLFNQMITSLGPTIDQMHTLFSDLGGPESAKRTVN